MEAKLVGWDRSSASSLLFGFAKRVCWPAHCDFREDLSEHFRRVDGAKLLSWAGLYIMYIIYMMYMCFRKHDPANFLSD